MIEDLHRALEHMDGVYRALRHSHDTGEVSTAEARRAALALAHTDELGRTWQIDTTRSSRHAIFMVTHDTSIEGDPGLAALAQQYERVVNDFESGRVGPDDAKRAVLEMSYVDSIGRRWLIDAARSTRAANFRTDEPVPERTQQITGEVPVIPPVASPNVFIPPLRQLGRRRHRLRAMAWAVAIAAVIGSALYAGATRLIDSTSDDHAAATNTTTATSGDGQSTSTAFPTASTIDAAPTTTIDPVPLAFTDGLTTAQVPFETPLSFGQSVQGRPLVVERRGLEGGVRVLIVGVIHGNEQVGKEVVDLLRKMDIGAGLDLWLVRSVNPDGMAANTRQNARGVDLNRNFPTRWEPIGQKGYWQYSGPSAASEPETKAMMQLARLIQPDLVIWYHQDYFRIEPKSGREGQIRARYAGLVDLPLLTISGGNYSGTANGWVKSTLTDAGMSMTVEFGPGLREGEAQANANAILTIVNEYFVEGADPPVVALP